MAVKKAIKPKHNRSDRPTMTGNPPLGYLNYYTCPVCGMQLFSFYDGDLKRPSFVFKISKEWNYCSKCGTMLDMSQWQDKEELVVGEEDLVLDD